MTKLVLAAELKKVPLAVYEKCYTNAVINRDYYYAKLDLKLVVGSLALGRGLGACFIYMDSFLMAALGKKNDTTAHAWLEDSKGNIYDHCFKEYIEFARVRQEVVTYAADTTICGLSSEELSGHGLWYSPAPANVQAKHVEEWKAKAGIKFVLHPGCHRNGCKQTHKLMCTRCKKRWYCSVECQKEDWKHGGHKSFCKA